MTIKDLGPRVASVWEGLRPETKKMLVGVLQSKAAPTSPSQRFAYDAHADWELSRLLSALDEQSKSPDSKANDEFLNEISALADTCVRVLESQSGSAEVFIQLAERAIRKHDYNKLDTLSDRLAERFSAGEIAEIVRQTEMPQIRAIAYETLAMLPVQHLVPLLDDPLYADIAANSLEQKAIEFESEEARDALDQYDYENELRGE
jgi:hypothetical protein